MSQEEEEGGQSNPRRSRGGVRLAYPEGSPRRRLRLIDTHKATIQDAGHSFHIQVQCDKKRFHSYVSTLRIRLQAE